MKTSITRKLIDTAKPKAKPYEIRCTRMPGLILRVQPTGVMTFYCEYDRNKRIKIGRANHVPLSDAHERVQKTMADVFAGVDPADQRNKRRNTLTLEDFLSEYYDPWATVHLKSGEALVKRIRSAFKAFLRKKLTEFSVFTMEKWRAERLKAGLKATTVNRDVGALKAALSRAEEWQLIEQNPLLKLKKLKVEDVTPPRYLQPDERKRFFEAIEAREHRRREERDRFNKWRQERGYDLFPDLKKQPFTDYLKPMILLSLNTGLRRNELFTLTWDNVYLDEQHPYVTVVAAFSKSKRSRHVQLNKIAVTTLRDWASIAADNPQNLVFAGITGAAFDNVKSSWKKLLRDAKLHNFRWHDMRHDFASRLAMAGVNLNTIRELLGHSDYKMTLRYAHLSPAKMTDAVNTLL